MRKEQKDPFTSQGIRVVRGMVQGLSDEAIAAGMGIQVPTVSRYRQSVYGALGLPLFGEVTKRWQQAQMVSAAAKLGHITAEEAEDFLERQRLPTPRQMEIILMTARGRSNRQIREELGVSDKDVSILMQNAVKRAGFKTRTELFEWLGLAI